MAVSIGAAGPASATTVELALDVASDGSGPFTPADGAGADSGPSNGIVRTHDHIVYRATVNALDGIAQAETIRVTAPADTSWGALPAECGAGSSVVGQLLTCNLGRLENSARAVSLSLAIAGSAPNGRQVSVVGTVSAVGATAPSQPVRSADTRVSAVPRYDLVKNGSAAIYKAGVPGPHGEPGMTLTYPITVISRPIVPGQGVLGAEQLAGPLRFRDDVSQLEGTSASRALLYTWGSSSCDLNTASLFHSLPGGRGGGRTNVAESGRIVCAQNGAGSPIDVTLSGTDTSLDSVPDLSSSGGAIEGGAAAYVASAAITVWIPNPEASGATWLATNTFTSLKATSISGQSDYGSSSEPLANNVSSRTVSQYLTGSGYKTYGRVTASGATVAASGKTGDPYVTPNTLLRAQVDLVNRGFGPYKNAIACDVFDNTRQTLAQGPGGRYAFSSGQPGAKVEYAAVAWTTPQKAQAATCGNDDASWFATPADVPGGPAAVGAVRVVADVPGAGQVDLFAYLRVTPGADGDRIRNFGQLYFGDTSGGEWRHDSTSPDIAAGPLSDFLIRTADLARVTKKVVDPGSDPATTPDSTKTITAGRQIHFALYPTVTSADTEARKTTVAVVDVLPAHSTFVPGSSSITPTRIDQVGSPGDPRQQLTWVLDDRGVNQSIDPIDYSVAVSLETPPGSIVNSASVSSPGDVSSARLRTAERAVEVVSSGGIAVEKTAVRPVVIVGDEVSWNLSYLNLDGVPDSGLDLIDVLPYAGDDGHSRVNGFVHLGGAIPIEAAQGESALYSSRDPRSVSLDGGDPSNSPGGTTQWCAEARFGSAGCPSSFDQVTSIRITRTTPVPVAATVTHRVTVTAPGAQAGDVLANRFGLRASNLVLPVRSDYAEVRFVSGSIGDRIWRDLDSNGLQSSGEPGVSGVRVRLSGVDDRGVPVRFETTSAKDGTYLFAGLRPGRYEVAFTAPSGSTWTKRAVGGDRAIDSDVDASGSTPVRLVTVSNGPLLDVQTDLTIDAGLVAVHGTPGHRIPPHHLAFTGSSAFWPAVVGSVMLVLGIVLAFVRRRRTRS